MNGQQGDERHPLETWLEQQDITKAELADRLGYSRSYITLIIKRQRKARPALRRVARLTGIDYRVLRGLAA